MRYFVIDAGDEIVESHIIAEVVRESFDDGRYRDVSMAAPLAGENMRIVADEELTQAPTGRRLIEAWRAGHDTAFDARTEALLDEATLRGSMRLVVGDEQRLPVDGSYILQRSADLVRQANDLVRRAQLRRTEHEAYLREWARGRKRDGTD